MGYVRAMRVISIRSCVRVNIGVEVYQDVSQRIVPHGCTESLPCSSY